MLSRGCRSASVFKYLLLYISFGFDEARKTNDGDLSLPSLVIRPRSQVDIAAVSTKVPRTSFGLVARQSPVSYHAMPSRRRRE